MRDHRLRTRRLKLGVSQFHLGCVAGFTPRSAQSMVSHVERSSASSSPAAVQKVRSALVWLETQQRREREWARADAAAGALVARAVAEGPGAEGYETLVVERLVSLLCDNRGDEFDVLAARVPAPLCERAGNLYLDLCTPVPLVPGNIGERS
jgi:hypothetical protein